MQGDVLLWQGFASLKKLSKVLTSPLNCLSFHGCKNKNKNTFFSPLIWEARSRGRCRTGPPGEQSCLGKPWPCKFYPKRQIDLRVTMHGVHPGLCPPGSPCLDTWVPLRISCGSLRTQIYSELCVHLRWNHCCGEESLPFYLLLSEAGPSRAKFMVYYLVCLVHRKMT